MKTLLRQSWLFLAVFLAVYGSGIGTTNAEHDLFQADALNFTASGSFPIFSTTLDTQTTRTWGRGTGGTNQQLLMVKFQTNSNARFCGFRSKIYTTAYDENTRLFFRIRTGGNIDINGQLTGATTLFEDYRFASHLPRAGYTTPQGENVGDYVEFPLTINHTANGFITDNQGCGTLTSGGIYWFQLQTDTPTTADENNIYVSYERSSEEYGNIIQEWSWTAGATLWTRTNHNLSFQLYADNPSSIFQLDPLSFPSSTSYNFVNGDFGLLGNLFRDIIVWAFFPDQAQLEKFGNLYNLIQNKPPLGYFYLTQTELGNLEIGTASVSFMANSITIIEPIINPLRTGLAWILWFLLALYLFKRISHLEL